MTYEADGLSVDLTQELRLGYRRCRQVTRRYGTTYYWGTVLLPKESRRHVYAVYALCRLADDIVDAPDATTSHRRQATEQRLTRMADDLFAVVDGQPAASPTMAAIAETIRVCGIPEENFQRFFTAMAADLETTEYQTWDDLLGYMEGSAAVIGEMMLPVLQPLSQQAFEPARALGFAFQLTNFLRDVAEDLDRGRIYLPQEDLRRYDADPALLRVTPQWRDLMRFEIARNRDLYDRADDGLEHLPPDSARCVGTARLLYSRILDRIEDADYDVFGDRIRVPTYEKAAVAARQLVAR